MTTRDAQATRSDYADILNALWEMQESFAYAVRRHQLAAAERAIVELEQRAKKAESALAAATARAEEAEVMMEQTWIDKGIASLQTQLGDMRTRAEAAESRLAALEAALREPTKEMMLAGIEAAYDEGGSWGMYVGRIYHAMTAVALSALPDAGKEEHG